MQSHERRPAKPTLLGSEPLELSDPYVIERKNRKKVVLLATMVRRMLLTANNFPVLGNFSSGPVLN